MKWINRARIAAVLVFGLAIGYSFGSGQAAIGVFLMCVLIGAEMEVGSC